MVRKGGREEEAFGLAWALDCREAVEGVGSVEVANRILRWSAVKAVGGSRGEKGREDPAHELDVEALSAVWSWNCSGAVREAVRGMPV
jgi:hypothetical protein